jgi:hypothetical protein
LEFIEDNINAQIIDNRKMELIKTPLNGIVSTFNDAIKRFFANNETADNEFYLGKPNDILKNVGIPNKEIVLFKSILVRKNKKHELNYNELKNLPNQIQSPVMVFRYDKYSENSYTIVYGKTNHEGLMIVGLSDYGNKHNKIEINEITTIHGKRCSQIATNLEKDLLLYSKNIDSIKKLFRDSSLNCLQSEQFFNLLDTKIKQLESKKQEKNKNILSSHENILSSVDFSHEKFKPIQFTGKWEKLIGNPAKPFTMMTYAKPGQGKSTLNLEFAGYLSKTHKKKVLYVSDEERLGYTLQEKIKRLDIANENLFVTGALPSKIDYDFVFIDSVNSMKLEPEDLKQLKEKHPKVSFIYIFQATKDGNFRGGQAYSHDVDVVIEAKNGEASTEKSRFGGNGTVKIF